MRQLSPATTPTGWTEAANAAAAEIVQYEEEPLDAEGSFAGGRFEVDAARLAAAHPSLARRVALQVLERAGERRVGFDHVERLRRLAEAAGTAPVAADFPGCRVERRGTMLGFTRRRGRPAPVAGAEGYEYPLAVPGAVEIPEAGLRVTAEHGERPARLVARGVVVALPAARITPPLTVRSRRPGDVFQPLGLGGRRKKLQDFFVDRKVPRDRRATVPLVVDERLGIVWVAGHGLGEGARMIGSDEGVIILKIVETGGSV